MKEVKEEYQRLEHLSVDQIYLAYLHYLIPGTLKHLPMPPSHRLR